MAAILAWGVAGCRPSPQVREGQVAWAGGGGQLAYTLVGSGADTIVVIHGGPGLQSRYLRPPLQPLSSSHGVLFYDQRGRGRSTPAPDSLLGLQQDVADLEALRQAMGLEKVTLVAHHFGAMIAAGYALAHPDHVARMVIVSPFVPRQLFLFDLALTSYPPATIDAYAKARAEGMPDKDPVQFCRRFWGLLLSPAKVSQPEVVADLAPLVCDAPPGSLRDAERINHAVVSSLMGWDWRDTLRLIRAPTLVIQGGDDPTLLHSARIWARAISDARLLVTGTPSLFPWTMGNETPFNAAIAGFLAGGWPRGADSVTAAEARSPGDSS
jgi:proline iminopeptidase